MMLRASEFDFKPPPKPNPPGKRPALTNEEVREIRKHQIPTRRKTIFYSELADKYGCSIKTIQHVLLGISHRDV